MIISTAYFEKIPNEDCGCDEDSSPIGWDFPVLCTLLLPIFFVAFGLWFSSHFTFGSLLLQWISMVGKPLNCFWYMGLVYDYLPLTCVSLDILTLVLFQIWILTIGSLNLFIDIIFPNLNFNIIL